MKCNDILIAGVGGQGTILASTLLGDAAMEAGIFARTGETIGMSQRGGCVLSHVRFDSAEKSSYIPRGQVELLIGFELAETARAIPFLKKGGCCVMNTQILNPVPVSLGMQTYEKEKIYSFIKENTAHLLTIDGYGLAQKAGSIKTVNVVLLGACAGAGFLPLEDEILQKTIEQNVPDKFRALNLAAFQLGYNAAKNQQ